ncbi:hypothetical protein M408DRAFT_192693 [Serendipita vermifera MAFF 305830]|uniref:HORMA domain-containing protein n=1 Tax=Serendipita vermifera MAFF 305830 TaxID=933852 RepID=A0A0C2WJ59_SERVB|nr:hypothetical protein M408DRAFT_192693 [Serendipita vermifera MAFF 305830]
MTKHEQIIELLYYSIHSILFHRTVYTREEFDITPKFGQTQYIVADYNVRNYIDTFLVQVDEWLESKEITHLVLVILSKDDGTTLERWTFDVTSKTPVFVTPGKPNATTQESTGDIAVPNVLKQIVAATTSLPDLPSPGVFTLQAYVATETGPEGEWRDVTETATLPFENGVETQEVLPCQSIRFQLTPPRRSYEESRHKTMMSISCSLHWTTSAPLSHYSGCLSTIPVSLRVF